MKQSLLAVALAGTLLASCASTHNQNDHANEASHAMESMDMGSEGQEMQMPMPTKEHQDLAKQVGKWSGTVTMDYPGVPPTPMNCSEEVSTFGGFWVTSEFHSDFMGMPYMGRSVMGYDAMKGKYVGSWIDSMSSYMAVMEGEYDQANNALVMEWDAPGMTGEMQPHRSVTKHRGNQMTMTFYTDGKQTMVISMTRQ